MKFYLIEDLEQGTHQWHKWRRGVIGASEAMIIMGENRFKGRQQLIDEKLGLITPFMGNAATMEGHALEGPAREALEKKFRHKLFPNIVQDASEPFLAASLDAINKANDKIYEIKCGFRTYEMVERNRKVPSHYVAQVQHMLMVTQMESLHFAVYRPAKPLITLKVFRNESYIRELRRKEKDFIRELESRGHKVQQEFRGRPIDHSKKTKNRDKKILVPIKSAWVFEDGLRGYWDGSQLLVGKKPGLYELDGADHYWDGQEWVLPDTPGYYILNRKKFYWDGSTWI